MANKNILPFFQYGGWTVPHSFYFPMAKNLLQQAKDLGFQIENRENEIKQKIKSEEPEWDEHTTDGYVHHLINEDYNQINAICISTQIFSCMAVEAFLNYYGVKRLGEDYYKRSLERLGISQKLETLIAICVQELIDDKSEIAITTRRMFDRRNKLAHPKSKEMFNNKGKPVFSAPVNPLEQAEQAVNDMVIFFNKFQEIDESIKFENPNNIQGHTVLFAEDMPYD